MEAQEPSPRFPIQGLNLFSLKAFVTTETELKDIAAPAMAGLK